MTISGGARSKDRVADDGLPDPLGPGCSVPEHPPADALPKGDVRVASWIAVASAIGVLLWYFSILVLGGVYLNAFNTPAQVAVWALAAVALTRSEERRVGKEGVIRWRSRRGPEHSKNKFIRQS